MATVVLCSPEIQVPVELRKLAARYDLDLPDEDEIRMTIVETFRSQNRSRQLRYQLDEEGLARFARSLKGLTLAEVRRLVTRAIFDDRTLSEADIPRAVERKREAMERSGVLDLIAVDSETAALGGFAGLKRWLERVRVGFDDRARALGVPPPRGVLLAGVQGCGKSLAAKTIAREWGFPLARLDPGRLFDKYVGESERNLRSALAAAGALAPVVLWIDEIEKVFSGAGGEADAGLGRRLFGSFLTWMQERRETVFLVATANDLDMLPPELLRKGRFDEVFFLDLPGAADRREIFEIHLRLRRQEPERFQLDLLAAATEGFSGAEIEQIVVAAIYGMLADGDASLSTERLLEEIRRTQPLSHLRRDRVEALRAGARERFVLAN
jgi:SpoVK/Ycf46/Vps4 family AAA+-type ATPase